MTSSTMSNFDNPDPTDLAPLACPICGEPSARDYWTGEVAPCADPCRRAMRYRRLTPALYRHHDPARNPNPNPTPPTT